MSRHGDILAHGHFGTVAQVPKCLSQNVQMLKFSAAKMSMVLKLPRAESSLRRKVPMLKHSCVAMSICQNIYMARGCTSQNFPVMKHSCQNGSTICSVHPSFYVCIYGQCTKVVYIQGQVGKNLSFSLLYYIHLRTTVAHTEDAQGLIWVHLQPSQYDLQGGGGLHFNGLDNLSQLQYLKCDNLPYNTLDRSVAGTNDSLTKHLMFHVFFFFFIISCKFLCKNCFNSFFFINLQKQK